MINNDKYLKYIEYKNNLRKRQINKLKNRHIKKHSVQILEDIHKKDTIFYSSIWKERSHYCQNCGKFLGNSFYDINGNITNLYRYAHIIPKSIYPYLRHYKYNLMLLCLDCHTKFDNSTLKIKEKMPCYNKKLIEKLIEYNNYLEKLGNNKYK